MIPLALDPLHLASILTGKGQAAVRRLAFLRDGGADPLVFGCDDDIELKSLAGNRWTGRLLEDSDIQSVRLLFVAGLDEDRSAELAGLARANRVLVNVEDVVPLCDFHVPSLVRRGDLLLTVSTSGRSPGLARMIRRKLEALFPPVWNTRLTEIAQLRDRLRKNGAPASRVSSETEALVAGKGWL